MSIQNVTLRPVDAGGGGHYRSGGKVSLTTIAANAPVVSFRWINTTLYAVIHKFAFGWFTSTAFGAAQIVDHALYKATAFSGSDTGGSTPVLTPKREAGLGMQALVAATDYDLRYGGLAAGTRTLKADFLASRGQWSAAVGNGIMPPMDVNMQVDYEGPLILGANEGLVLNNLTLMGATGVIQLYWEIAFSVVTGPNLPF